MYSRYCISCGDPFDTNQAEVVLCPTCGGLPASEPESTPVDLTQAINSPLASGEEAGVRSDWQSGDVILDTYEVKGELGQGGFGKVYCVHHRSWDIDLAVKRPLKLEEASKQSFVDEAEKWVELGLHPHIVSCYYVRSIDGFPHTFAELADGGSLKDWIEDNDRKLYSGGQVAALERILDIAIQFAWGLGYAHDQGLVHQDVKPGNVLMTRDGIAKVSDFGLAKARAEAGEGVGMVGGGSLLVSSGGMTPAYCSPEQARGEKLSLKTDIWSWGVSVLEMFAGEVYWRSGEAAGEVLEGYLEEGAPEPGLPPIPEGVGELLGQCFRREPAERPKDMLEIAGRLLEIYQQETGQVYPRQLPKAAELRADSLNNKALSMLDLGKEDKAEELFHQALKVDDAHPEATYNLALIEWRRGEIDDLEVVSRLEHLLTALPERWPSAFLLGLAHMERWDLESALASFQGMEGISEAQRAIKQARKMAPGAGLIWKMEGHSSEVNSIAITTDGGHALSGSSDKTLRLWEMETGACQRIFAGHQMPVTSVAISPDGNYALSGSLDRTLRLWKIQTGECLRIYPPHNDEVRSVAFSPDGRYLLSGCKDKTLLLWSVGTSASLRSFMGHQGPVNSISYNPDGRYAISGSDDKTLVLWNVGQGERLRTFFGGHKRGVTSVAFSSDGRYALSGSRDATLRLWEIKSGGQRTFEGHKDEVLSVAFSPDGRYALSGSRDDTMRLWQVETGACLRTFQRLSNVNSVIFSPDGHYALSGSGFDLRMDNSIRKWRVEEIGTYKAPFRLTIPQTGAQVLDREQTFTRQINQAVRSLQQRDYATAMRCVRQARALPGFERADSALDAWFDLYNHCKLGQFRSGWEVRSFEGCGFAFSPDGRYVLSLANIRKLQLIEAMTGACQQTFEAHQGKFGAYGSAAFSPNGRYIFSGAIKDSTLRLFEVATGACLRKFNGHESGVKSLAFSPDGCFVLIGSPDPTLRLWEVETGVCLRSFEGHTFDVISVAYSPDGRYALSGSQDMTLRLWEVNTGACLRIFDGIKIWVNSIAFSPDGRYALSGNGNDPWYRPDPTLRLWNVDTGACLRTFEGHKSDVRSVAFSPDGRNALSGSTDGTLKLWEVESGRCLWTYELHEARFYSVAFSQNSRHVIASYDLPTRNAIPYISGLWTLDWELEDYQPADWDESAQPYLETFLILHTPYVSQLPKDREPTEEEITLALTRRGKPTWTEDDFQGLLYTLGCAGYGWLRPEGVRRKLEKMAAGRK